MKKAVSAPTSKIRLRATSDNSYRGDIRATMKMPAVTIVAAWINAEIGVGPSMESGSQTCRGTCADFPIAPINRQIQIKVSADHSSPGIREIVESACASAWSNTCT